MNALAIRDLYSGRVVGEATSTGNLISSRDRLARLEIPKFLPYLAEDANGVLQIRKVSKLDPLYPIALDEFLLLEGFILEFLAYKHLSGKHSQKRHAGSGGAGGLADSLLDRASEYEPHLTASLDSVVGGAGGKLEGLEFRMKSKASLERKLKDEFRQHPQLSLEEVASSDVTDTIRYTAVFSSGRYRSGIEATRARLEASGASVVKARNYWRESGGGYRGVNTVFQDPSGVRFELQFHTPQSFRIKMSNHKIYEEARLVPNTSSGRSKLRDLLGAQERRWGTVKSPPGAEDAF